MTKAYIVARVGWQYNDEGYSTSWDGDTYDDLTEAYYDEEDARIAQLANTIAFLRSDIIHAWYGLGSYSMEELYVGNVDREYLQELFPNYDYEDRWDLSIPKYATDEQLTKIAKRLGNTFYEVIETQIN